MCHVDDHGLPPIPQCTDNYPESSFSPNPIMDLPTSLYEPDDDNFHPTGLTRGRWDAGFQHAGPPAALLARAVERVADILPGEVGRLGFDILRPVPLAPHRIATRTLRPG